MRWLALNLLLVFGLTQASGITDRMTLAEAIETVRQAGYEVAYSSRLVKPWMRVRSIPSEEDPVLALNQALAEHELKLQSSENNQWLVVRGEALSNIASKPTPRSPRNNTDPEQPKTTLPRLEEIAIISSQYSLFKHDAASRQFLTGEEIRLMPHIADDAFRAFHRLPGVAANDFQAPFNLRGGAVDEVKVVLDGLELFEPYHMRSVFSPLSIVDPGIIGQAQLLSGGYTAEYGHQMSGVIEITSKSPVSEPTHQVGLSFVNAFARSQGNFSEGRGAYLVSARRGFLDLIGNAVADEDEDINPRYSDIFLSSSYQLNDSVEVSAKLLWAADDVEYSNDHEHELVTEDSSLYYAWFTIDAEPIDDLNVRAMIFTGDVDTEEFGIQDSPPYEVVERFFARDIGIKGLQADLSWSPNERINWKFGGRLRTLSADFDYHLDSLRQTDITNNGVPIILQRDIVTQREGDELGLYGAIRFELFQNLAWELGLRWDKETYTGTEDNTQLSPRINAFYQAGDNTELRFGWGHFYQPHPIQNLNVSDGVTDYFPAQRAEQWIIGLKHRFDSGLEFELDVYDKKYSDLRPRFESVLDSFQFAPETKFERVRIEPDSGRSRGVEFTVHNRQFRSLDWWLSYTWSKSNDVIDGLTVPRSWDQRHSLTGNLIWRGDKWSLSLMGRYHSGWPRTPLVVIPNFDDNGNFTGGESDLTNRNTRNYDDYARVDIRLSRHLQLERSNLEFYLEVFNVFDKDNQCCVPDFDVALSPGFSAAPNFDELLPFFPSFGFVWTF